MCREYFRPVFSISYENPEDREVAMGEMEQTWGPLLQPDENIVVKTSPLSRLKLEVTYRLMKLVEMNPGKNRH